jgi:RNase H-fold protein (predicted Holliday junction resolvase)
VAHALDWKKVAGACVLSLHVGKDCIDLAVTSRHPSLDKCVQPLPSIPLKTTTTTTCTIDRKNNSKRAKSFKTLHPSVVEELHDLVEDWDVCGFVVSWPVQKEGRCGAQCGRVLHTLDQIVQADGSSNSSSMFNHSRPVCLWDSNHIQAWREDEWGRSATYAARTSTCTSSNSNKTIHYASVEQYQDDGAIAAEIAADYMRHFFPEQHQHYSDILASSTSSPAVAVARAVSSSKRSTTTTIPAAAASPQFDMAWFDDDSAGEEQTETCGVTVAL